MADAVVRPVGDVELLAGELYVLVEECRDVILEVLASYLAGAPAPTASDAAMADDGPGSLRSKDDLTANRQA
ncbi:MULTISPECIES: hypothetical protein [Streptomyces]|uniref:Uncharacterized protein n=1 Tax=Streptomyces demainii TaxID=588122 RepID=A0ABT9KSD3_9ACTN|nr:MULTISPECIES: hypothetical protein [Streptomyces]MDP9611269.1 hypothetical protein [Streptomyces demainii]